MWFWPGRRVAGAIAVAIAAGGTAVLSHGSPVPAWFVGVYLVKLVVCFAHGVRSDAVSDSGARDPESPGWDRLLAGRDELVDHAAPEVGEEDFAGGRAAEAGDQGLEPSEG